MTLFEGLTPDRQNADAATQRVTYHPVIVTVGMPSKFPDQATQLMKGCAFEELDGFWDWHKDDLLANNIPPRGSVIMVRLSTNPKQSGGTWYQDVAKWKYAVEGEFPMQSVRGGGGNDDGWGAGAPQQAPRDGWHDETNPPHPQPAENIVQTPAGEYHRTPYDYNYVAGVEGSQERERKVSAWNGLTQLLQVAHIEHGVFEDAFPNPDDRAMAVVDWAAGYEALKRGEVPFQQQPEASAMEQAAMAMGAKPVPEHESGMAPPEQPNDGFGAPEKLPW